MQAGHSGPLSAQGTFHVPRGGSVPKEGEVGQYFTIGQAQADAQQATNQMQNTHIHCGKNSLPNAAVENAISVAQQ